METLCELTTRPFLESDQKDTDGLRIGDNVGRFSFLLKTDADDVFVSIEAVLSSLCKLISPKEILCEGKCNKNPWGFRNGKKGSKLGRLNFYGCFIQIFAWVSCWKHFILRCGSFVCWGFFHSSSFLRQDGVYVGMLANKFGIKVTHLEGFELKTPKHNVFQLPM